MIWGLATLICACFGTAIPLASMLIVDPNLPSATALARIVEPDLCPNCPELALCADFSTARARLRAAPPELLITALRLREYNGLNLVYLAAGAGLRMRSIVFTDDSDSGMAREVRAAGRSTRSGHGGQGAAGIHIRKPSGSRPARRRRLRPPAQREGGRAARSRSTSQRGGPLLVSSQVALSLRHTRRVAFGTPWRPLGRRQNGRPFSLVPEPPFDIGFETMSRGPQA